MTVRLRDVARLKASGQLERALGMVEEALRTETPQRVELLRELADIRSRKGQFRDAHEALDAAHAALAKRGADVALEQALLERRAWVFFREGNLPEARHLCTTLIETAEKDRDANAALLADLHNTMGGILWNEGKIDEAMAEISESIALHDQTRNPAGAAYSRLNLGVLCFSRGDWKRARRYLLQAHRIRAANGTTQGLASGLLNLGVVELYFGNLTSARRYLEEAVSVSRSLGEEPEGLLAQVALVQTDIQENRLDCADARVQPILRARRTLGDDVYVQALGMSALIERGRGNVPKALDLAREARRKARANGVVETEADVCRTLGIIYRAAGHLHDARFSFDESLRLAIAAKDPYRRALALFELAVTTHDRTKAEEAMTVFKHLGARYDLNRARFQRV